MNKDINRTLQALVPILRMNGEKVVSIEAVKNSYYFSNMTYIKEVAEITYENGHCIYADIGGDSNLTALYDVLAVIQQIKKPSAQIMYVTRAIYDDDNVRFDLVEH